LALFGPVRLNFSEKKRPNTWIQKYLSILKKREISEFGPLKVLTNLKELISL
jgi:hypothetical protein